mmetsp:Transcript_60820/g.100558  ORF Transcript_60820/g.100558 Transcript_60820/m.100558 type:complete len:88 (+) Transcript_60820:333-596(+)
MCMQKQHTGATSYGNCIPVSNIGHRDDQCGLLSNSVSQQVGLNSGSQNLTVGNPDTPPMRNIVDTACSKKLEGMVSLLSLIDQHSFT